MAGSKPESENIVDARTLVASSATYGTATLKYMGSKRVMLENGLGELIYREGAKAHRIVDLFTCSGAVAWFAASRLQVPVHAFDLQEYGVALAGSVVSRTRRLDGQRIWEAWSKEANHILAKSRVPVREVITSRFVKESREWAAESGLPVTMAYGGYYYSPYQSVVIDALRGSIEEQSEQSTVMLAALIQAASECAASPGHTAQPFQPTNTAIRFLADAWGRDVSARTKRALEKLCAVHALSTGRAERLDANLAVKALCRGDLAFVDPPYSGVHYSRFYHVLETIACGGCGAVSGRGRYPAFELRPRSKYSVASEAENALVELLRNIAEREASAIVTFPDHECSNGLSGEQVRRVAKSYFAVTEHVVKSKFSTLGGIGRGESGSARRSARQSANELILHLRPR